MVNFGHEPARTEAPTHVVKEKLTVSQTMEILRTTVPRLAELTDGVPRESLHAPTDYGWSVNEQLAHLRSCHDILGGNMLRIVREDHPAWKGVAPTRNQNEHFGTEFYAAFATFRAQRAELLEVLEPLPEAAWERTATVSVPPRKTYEYSVLYYGGWMARHERSHLKHIARIVGTVGQS